MVYVVATPIGNLKDISLRALEVFKSVDTIICEDTRVTQKILNHFEISVPTLSHHQQSGLSQTRKVFDLIRDGKEIAIVTDAGTPGIQDPGNKLISEILDEFGESVAIVPVPGPSAVTALASVSGVPTDSFVFIGYIPKKGQQKVFEEIASTSRTILFYETGPRIFKTLESLRDYIPERQLVIGRELTKKHEQLYRGTIDEVVLQLKNSSIKGEFVVLVARK